MWSGGLEKWEEARAMSASKLSWGEVKALGSRSHPDPLPLYGVHYVAIAELCPALTAPQNTCMVVFVFKDL